MVRFIISLFFLATTSFALGESYFISKFKHLSVEEGLTNNRVISIVQDSVGFIWMATHGGVEKYSGNRLQHYSLSKDPEFSQKDNVINSLIYSNHFDVLCGTRNGNIYSYNRGQDEFELISQNRLTGLFNITALFCNSKDGIWVGTGGGLMFFKAKDKSIQTIEGLQLGINTIVPISNHEILIGTLQGLNIVNTITKEVKTVKLNHPDNKTSFTGDILSICPLDSQTIILGTRNSELLTLIRKEASEDFVLSQLIKLRQADQPFPILDITQTPNKLLALALDGFGILIYDMDFNIRQEHIADVDDLSSLSSNGVYDLFYCKDDLLWAATYGGGVNIADPNQKDFRITQHQPYLKNSLGNNFVKAVIESSDGRLWIGTKQGISIHNPLTSKWTHYPPKSSDQSFFHVMDMIEDLNGDIWVASYGSGLIRLDPKTLSSSLFNEEKHGFKKLETDHLYRVFQDSKTRIWTGGIWGNISVIDYAKEQNFHIDISNMRAILEHDGYIYIGSLFGLYQVDIQDLSIKRPTPVRLLNERIISLTKHPLEDKLYLGTESNGLMEWQIGTDSIKIIDDATGLPSNYIRSIAWDKASNIWLGSTGGLIKLNPKNDEIDHYTITDGLANTEFNENAVFSAKDGRLYWGGPKGLTHFYPAQITKSKLKPKPILTQIKLFGEVLNIDTLGPLKQSLNVTNGMELRYNQNSIGFLFDAITFTNQQKILFKWRMKGLEEQWNGPSVTREAIYSKLPPGEYTFQVMVSNDDGIWQEKIKEFRLNIRHPLWATKWAFFIYMILLVGLIYTIFKFYHIIIQEKHSSEKQQFFISIAHDLRTPLSLIKLPIEKMVEKQSNTPVETQNLTLIKRNIDRLTNLVNQLLDFQKSDLKKMTLITSKNALHNFIQERIDAFAPLSKEKNISVYFHHPEDETMLWFDRGKMEKIMYNLLSNAFKYTGRGGQIFINVSCQQGKCILSVKDTGEGIPTNQQKNIFKRYYRASNAINSQEVGSGVGLVLTKQLVELHKGTITFSSQQGVGSEFIISIPTGKSHLSPLEMIEEEDVNEKREPIFSVNPSKEEQKTDGPRLLLVEDNIELLDSLSTELKLNYQVACATNGEDALKAVEDNMPDIIVSDIMMPIMNGHELCIKLKRNISTCHIPIILLTALDSPDYKREGLEHGADAYLEKPFDLKLLKAQIANLLKNRQLLKARFLQPSTNLKDVSPTNADQIFLEKIKTHVIENVDNEELSVENTARELGMSRPVLYRKIKAITDLSPQQFVMTIKLKEAARIMKEEEANISETAYRTGFSDPKYFSQTFKKYFGKTPSQYLKEDIENDTSD